MESSPDQSPLRRESKFVVFGCRSWWSCNRRHRVIEIDARQLENVGSGIVSVNRVWVANVVEPGEALIREEVMDLSAKLLSAGCAVSAVAWLGLTTMPVAVAPASSAVPRATHFGPNANLKKQGGDVGVRTRHVDGSDRVRKSLPDDELHPFSITNLTQRA